MSVLQKFREWFAPDYFSGRSRFKRNLADYWADQKVPVCIGLAIIGVSLLLAWRADGWKFVPETYLFFGFVSLCILAFVGIQILAFVVLSRARKLPDSITPWVMLVVVNGAALILAYVLKTWEDR